MLSETEPAVTSARALGAEVRDEDRPTAEGLADPARVEARFERGLALLIEHAAGVLG